MNQSPHVNLNITVRNLPPSAETRSTVVIKVERLVNEYISTTHNAEPTFNLSYHSCPPQLFSFDITSITCPSQILQILRTELELTPELNLSIAADIYRRAIDMFLGRTAIFMDVLVQISYDAVLDIGFLDFLSSVGEEEEEEEEEEAAEDDFVENFVRDCKIGDESGLEKESCSICLENLLEDSEKIPTRMPCSHFFHDECILQWLRRKNSCPLCRQVFRE